MKHYSREQHRAWRKFEAAIESFRIVADTINRGLVEGPVTAAVTDPVWEASLEVCKLGLLQLVKQSELTIIKLSVPPREKLVHELRTNHHE